MDHVMRKCTLQTFIISRGSCSSNSDYTNNNPNQKQNDILEIQISSSSMMDYEQQSSSAIVDDAHDDLDNLHLFEHLVRKKYA
jgi:hypothetical protein